LTGDVALQIKQIVQFPSPRKQKYLFLSPSGEGARRADKLRGVGGDIAWFSVF
jgi:hypothetical protein